VLKWMSVPFVLVSITMSMAAQSKPSIEGAWRMVELTVTDSPAGRRDPYGAYGVGTHTRLQPDLTIFTAKHYSRTTDTGAEPRPTIPYKAPGNPTLDELQAEWGPFVANAGTYELSGTTLTLRAIVAKNPRAQREKNFTRLTVKLEGTNLWMTPIDTEAGPIPNPVTIKLVRME
jgi:hypothetical protein